METVIVTGGCGFIGSNFIRLLFKEAEYNIICIDKMTYAGNYDNIPETNTLNWNPQVEFETGIQLTIQWYLDNQKWYQDIIRRKNHFAERLGLKG